MYRIIVLATLSFAGLNFGCDVETAPDINIGEIQAVPETEPGTGPYGISNPNFPNQNVVYFLAPRTTHPGFPGSYFSIWADTRNNFEVNFRNADRFCADNGFFDGADHQFTLKTTTFAPESSLFMLVQNRQWSGITTANAASSFGLQDEWETYQIIYCNGTCSPGQCLSL